MIDLSNLPNTVIYCPMLSLSLSTDNKEYDAYLSYTKVDLDSLGRSGFLDVFVQCCVNRLGAKLKVRIDTNETNIMFSSFK